ncbi:hypothetical protein F4821DRAFT_105442 [Hypoxylon rubiginosum]|uniref:Uncharacterized protein n=1 Tax=Hypoxylon rubiginosum TaxID=110542 RepID=A0ACC0D4A7_9PEZI|nr:hypothetical protein F4821DRAFT_105442 [Hypoxylon rubiginosum]
MTAVVASPSHQSSDDPLPANLPSSAVRYRERESRKQASRLGRVGRPTRISKLPGSRTTQSRKSYAPHPRWGPDREDGRQLAADPNLLLPSDRSRSKPRLERQEAFHQPKTQLYHSDAVEDDSDLYKLGLLYDDEHTRGSYFNLNTIVHSDPVYLVRPTKRAKKRRQDSSYLYLDLSYSSLGSDADVQQFLVPDLHEIPAPLDDRPMARKSHEDDAARKRSYRDAALSTIHELPENPRSLLEPTVSEVTDIPDLMSDEDEDEDESGDWALLEETEVLGTADADASADGEDAADAIPAAGDETWVVLGDGS